MLFKWLKLPLTPHSLFHFTKSDFFQIHDFEDGLPLESDETQRITRHTTSSGQTLLTPEVTGLPIQNAELEDILSEDEF